MSSSNHYRCRHQEPDRHHGKVPTLVRTPPATAALTAESEPPTINTFHARLDQLSAFAASRAATLICRNRRIFTVEPAQGTSTIFLPPARPVATRVKAAGPSRNGTG